VVVPAVTFGFLFLFAQSLPAQAIDSRPDKIKYWIFLNDKGNESADPEGKICLSVRALERRMLQGIPLDSKDFPVHEEYCHILSESGIVPYRKSRWLNAVSTWMDSNQVKVASGMDFVSQIRPVGRCDQVYAQEESQASKVHEIYDSLFSFPQLQQLGLDKLHTHGYNGRGVTIAVFDTEFANADSNPAFSHLFQSGRILAAYDFVNDEEDVYSLSQGSAHAAWVLSILSGHIPGNYMGSAPGASFILCHTENTTSETHTEEDNWVAAAEWADSIGAWMFTTSLGYSVFDPLPIEGEFIASDPTDESADSLIHNPVFLTTDYDYNDMDGNTTIITRAADIAASRGIIVLNSAGNEGGSTWNYITSPADGDSVIAVGAIREDSSIAGFSSRGPSFDGRVKPDFVAMGQGNSYLTVDGKIGIGSGTSFSCPTLAGLVACILQAKPGITYGELHAVMRGSAWLPDNPDSTAFGYGLPNGPKMMQLLGFPLLTDQVTDFQLTSDVIVYPVPAGDPVSIVIQNRGLPFEAAIRLTDLAGRLVLDYQTLVRQFNHRIDISRDQFFGNFPEGRMILTVINLETGEVMTSRSVYLLKE